MNPEQGASGFLFFFAARGAAQWNSRDIANRFNPSTADEYRTKNYV